MTTQTNLQIETKTTSAQWKVNLADWFETAEYGAIFSIIGIAEQAVESFSATQVLHFDFATIGKFALVGALTAVIKKWKAKQLTIVTNPQDVAVVNAAASGTPIIRTTPQDDSAAKPDKAS